MPRDDLSIDFVKKMPQTEPLDPAVILDEWFNRVQNLPEEVRFIQDEIADKDRSYAECTRIAEDRDGKIQKWIKTHGSHEPNPREDQLRAQVRENYTRAEKIAAEKLALTNRLQAIMDKHLRSLDVQIKLLYDRAEPGFSEPNEVPSLLRPSPANKTAPSLSLRNPSNLATVGLASSAAAGASAASAHSPATSRASTTQIRNAQATHQHAASAPATPAASIILNRNQRENSAGAAGQKRPRLSNSANGGGAAPSSSLARHSSLGPGGTPKSAAAAAALAASGSGGPGGPRASSVKATGSGAGGGRKAGTPSGGVGREKVGGAGGNPKSSLVRVRKSTKTSPASTGDSELSDADSGSDISDNDGAPGAGGASGANSGRGGAGTPVDGGAARGSGSGSGAGGGASGSATLASGAAGASSHDALAAGGGGGAGGMHGHVDGDEDEEMGDADYDESGDNKKYCLCQKVSFGDMVACDNDNCPYEWFHWSCVGLESEPNGTWYCPVCDAKKRK